MLYYGLLASFFLDYVRPGAYIGAIAATKIGTIVPLLVFFASLFYKGTTDNQQVMGHRNTKWLIFFCFLLLLSLVLAEVTLYSFTVIRNVSGFIIWYYIISRIVTDLSKLHGVFVVLVFSHLIILLLNPQVVLNPTTRSYVYGNPFMGDGNDFSLSICIVIPMCLYLVITAKSKLMKMAYGGVLLVLILAVIGTQSRGASLALSSSFLYLWWFGRQKFVGILLVLLALGVVLIYAPPAYFERMNTISNYENEGSAKSRIIAWTAATKMALKYPVTGVGTGHFPTSIGTEFRPLELDSNVAFMTAHSMYFLILGELGIPGIVFLLSMLMGNFFRNQFILREARARPDPLEQRYSLLFFMLNGSLISFCVGGAFLSVAYYPHLYVLAGLFTASQCMYRKHRSQRGVAVNQLDSQGGGGEATREQSFASRRRS